MMPENVDESESEEREREPCPFCGEKWECTPCCKSRCQDGAQDES